MAIKVTKGQQVRSLETGMVGTVREVWQMNIGEWWISVQWDPSTMEAAEVEPIN